MSGAELVDQLRSTLDRAAELTRTLENNLRLSPQGEAQSAGERVEQLERRLSASDSDVQELAIRLVESEHQAERLMNLYVATYQLYSSLTPDEVQVSIAEIAINLLGAERFVLLLQRTPGQGCEVALAEGFDGPVASPFSDGRYQGGDSMVDSTLVDGVLRTGPSGDSNTLAVVPLRVRSTLVGVLVILKLLDHKPILGAEDRDLLDVLSAHAASALFAAGLFEAKDRKLRTLESLMQLVRGGADAESDG